MEDNSRVFKFQRKWCINVSDISAGRVGEEQSLVLRFEGHPVRIETGDL